MAGKRVEIVAPGLAGPLDRAVRGLFGVSWGKARAWIAAGKVRLGGEPVTEETARVPPGAEITLDEQAPRSRSRRPPSRRLPRTAGEGAGAERSRDVADVAGAVLPTEVRVLHADPHVVVVAKPAGLSTVPFESDRERRPGTPEDTLEARVRKWVEQRGGSRRAGRPNLGVVHRLDKETTGLLVFTRTWLAKQSLSAQFRRHSVHRRYLAIAHGDVKPRAIRSVLVADRGDGLRGSSRMSRPGDGREAGHPIVGERVYIRNYTGPLIDAPRLMLHAAELGFVHPATGQAMQWELPLPDDMRSLLDRLRRS
jgi:23S rRNA pseudouridine1911/1915/1917 synthase